MKHGYLFIGFETNIFVLMLAFAEEVDGKSYKDSKNFC